MHHPIQLKLIRIYFFIVSHLFPSLAVVSAYRVFHYPVNSKRKNLKEKITQEPERFNITFDKNTTLQAYRWGNKQHPVILLVHGWSTTARSMSHFIDILLKNHYQVISYDALRHGDSRAKLSDLADWADSVRTVMKNIGPVECIIAHSFGGAAVTVASKLGLETKKLVFISPIHDIVSVSDSFAIHLRIPAEIVEKMRDYTWKNNEKNFQKYGKDWQDIFASDFHVPTIIFHDKEDKEISIDHSKDLCERWTWATLKQTTGLGHRTILDDETVVKETLAFIQTQENL